MRSHEGPTLAAELWPLWQNGQRAAVIRKALETWEALVSEPSDAQWLEQALRAVGLPREAFALQAARTRARGDARSWEVLIGNVLRSGDPWWARTLIADEGTRGSSELETLDPLSANSSTDSRGR